MNKKINGNLPAKIAAILSAMIALSAMSSCALADAMSNGRDSIFNNNNGGETTSSAESETAAEPERFDYFSADVSQYITLSKDAYTDISVDVDDIYHVTDEMVDKYIDSVLFEKKTVKNGGAKVTDKALARGDTAYIFYKGIIDGKEFEGGSNMDEDSPAALSLGSGKFIPGFEDALIGVVPNKTSLDDLYKIDLKFPENYNKELAGKDVTFYVYVAWSVQYEIPEFDEKFVTETLKFETDKDDVLAAYKEYVRERFEEENEAAKKDAIINAVWKKLLAASTIKSYPEGEVEFFYDNNIDQFEQYYEYMIYVGYSFESFDEFACEYMGLEKGAEWKEVLRDDCKNRVTRYLVVHIIAQQENIVVTDEAYEAEIQYYIDYYSGQSYTKDDIIKIIGEANLKESALNTLVIQNFVLGKTAVNMVETEQTSEQASEQITE